MYPCSQDADNCCVILEIISQNFKMQIRITEDGYIFDILRPSNISVKPPRKMVKINKLKEVRFIVILN